ncbi:MAG: protein-S-isoprenylcysteine O-methyltransferase [Bacteroidota bacterium]
MTTITLKICFMLFWIATGIIRYPFSKKQKENKISQDNKTPLEKTLLAGASLGMLILPLLYVFTPFLSFADYEIPLWAQIIGLAVMPLTLWLFYRSHKDLGQNWSPSLEIRDEHSLVNKGVYKKIRHPMYSAIWLWGIVQFCLLPNYLAGFSAIVFFGILYFFRVDKEEQMLIKEFGDSYKDYMEETGRLIPKFT